MSNKLDKTKLLNWLNELRDEYNEDTCPGDQIRAGTTDWIIMTIQDGEFDEKR